MPIPYIVPGFMPDGWQMPNATGNFALGPLDPTRPLSDAIDSAKEAIFGTDLPEENRTIENSAYADFPGSVNTIDYLDAPYAEHYGMSAETAYQEALAGSAYQRKVADLKKAGLNPVLGIQGNGSSSFGGSLASGGSYNSGYSVDEGFKLNPQVAGALATVGALVVSRGKFGLSSVIGSAVQNLVYGINAVKR